MKKSVFLFSLLLCTFVLQAKDKKAASAVRTERERTITPRRAAKFCELGAALRFRLSWAKPRSSFAFTRRATETACGL